MGVTNSNKVINTDRISCDGTLRVTLALTAAPDIVSNPRALPPGWTLYSAVSVLRSKKRSYSETGRSNSNPVD